MVGPFVGGLVNPLNWPSWFKKRDGVISLAVNRVGHKGPVWDQTTKPLLYYNSTPEFKIAVDRKAAMFSNMEIVIKDRTSGKRAEGSEVKKLYALLNKPNVTQSFNQWLKEHKQHESVYGSSYMYANKVTEMKGFFPVALWNISPEYIRPILTGRMFDQVKIEEIIEKYEYRDGNTEKYYLPSEILYTRLTDLLNPVAGQSPIVALNKPLSNIKHAYDYRNVIMSEKGAIGILSNKSKDGAGAIPMKKGEKEKLEAAYLNNFGIGEGKRRIHITEGSMSWEPMSYPTKDLLLFEEVSADFVTIINMLGLNINMFINSTYDNVENGIIQTYQDTIQPEADQFCQSLAEFLGVSDRYILEASYDHIPVMKKAKLNKIKAVESLITSFNNAVAYGFMDGQTATNILSSELDVTPITYQAKENESTRSSD